MRAIVIIPSRMGASRFPGKSLKPILGLPMVGHCYYRSKLANNVDEVFVATPDDEIMEYITGIGGKAILTSHAHERASTRTAEALEKLTNEGLN